MGYSKLSASWQGTTVTEVWRATSGIPFTWIRDPLEDTCRHLSELGNATVFSAKKKGRSFSVVRWSGNFTLRGGGGGSTVKPPPSHLRLVPKIAPRDLEIQLTSLGQEDRLDVKNFYRIVYSSRTDRNYTCTIVSVQSH